VFEVQSAEAPSRSQQLSRYVPPLAGLLAGGIVALTSGLPPSTHLPWTQLLGLAVQETFEVSLASVLTAAALCAVISRRYKVETDRIVIQTSLAALWLLPLAICIGQNSVWIVAIAAIFTVTVARSFFAPRDDAPQAGSQESNDNPDEAEWLSDRLFGHEGSFQTRVSFAAALCAQIGLLAALAGYSIIAAVLVGIGVSTWTWSFTQYAPELQQLAGAQPFRRHRLLTSALAFLFTLGALTPYLLTTGPRGRSRGIFPWPAAAHGGSPAARRAKIAETPVTGTTEGNPGIVLWPEQVVTKLVMPTPTRESLSLTSLHNANPLIVPFNGVYWFFKEPDTQPPRNSRQAHASPETVEIHSTDQRPLSIEAHDALGTLVDLDCCSKIQVAIRNADRYPETVSLELVLINASLPEKPSQSLGRLMVKSTRPWKIYEKQQPVSETLSFPIPEKRALRRFDEMKVVFRLDRARADAGAKIAIDHFVLVPRGL